MLAASVIVPARNAEATLSRTLQALGEQDLDRDYEVIVVDDGSTDGTAALVASAAGPVRLVTQRASGPAAARNRGVAESRGGALAFCDADCCPEPGWLRAGVEALAQADLVQGKVLPDPLAPLGPFDRTLWVTREAGLWETASLFVTRAMFDRVGGFEQWLRPLIGKDLAEDVWFGWRARRAGARSCFCEDALVLHAVFARGPREYALEHRRLRYFPAMAAKMPELRTHLLHRRWFLNPRTAAFDAALVGAALGAVSRSPLPLALAAPYGRMLVRHGRRGGRWSAPLVAVWDLAADAVGAVELAHGSVRYRSLVL